MSKKVELMAVSKKLAKRIREEKERLKTKESAKRKRRKNKRITIADACDSLFEKIR